MLPIAETIHKQIEPPSICTIQTVLTTMSLNKFTSTLHNDLFTWTVLLSASVVSYWLLPFLHGLFFAPTRNVRGPLLARISKWFEYRMVQKGDSNIEYIRLHERFGSLFGNHHFVASGHLQSVLGPIVRVGPTRYSFSNPADVKVIYELGGKFIKTEFYEPLKSPKPEQQNIFAIRDPNYHKDRRRKIANLYSMSTMVSYEDAVNRMNIICMRKLTEFANEARRVSLPDFMQYYAFDVIGEITVRL